MALTLKITSYQSQTLGADSSKVFTEVGGSIGRAQGNDWVLPDPERYISGRHAVITCQGGQYYITDTSTNGVFINGSSTPLGNGNSAPIKNGDRITFGDYELEVLLDAAAVTSPPSGQWSPDTGGGDVLVTSPTGRPDMPESLDPLSFTSPPTGGQDTNFPDPFATPPPPPGAEADHVPSVMEAFQPPSASVEQIPDDWDMTDYVATPGNQPAPVGSAEPGSNPTAQVPSPGPAAAVHPAPAAVPPAAAPVTPAPRETAQVAPVAPVTAAGDELFAAFLRGAGIDPASVGTVNSVEAMQNYGALFREVVQGLMEVLMARASLKSEFRMPLTTIRPVENNPLKFSPNVDDAMRNLFMHQGSGYLSPVEAVREGFEDIKSHQMAMVAGMQAAFRDMLQRIDPASFQEHEKGVRGALMSVNRKSRAWDSYCEFYKKVTRDTDSSFQTLFGEEFARAYEEQIQRLTALQRK